MIEGSRSGGDTPRLKYGMVGGGPEAFIGDVHRKAIALDGKAELVAGCFSQDFSKTKRTGYELGLDKSRLYADYEEMAEAESKRDNRLDFVLIVTPNSSHYLIARCFMERGFHIVCDKPLTTSSRDAVELGRLAQENNLLFCVTYAYTGYPVVKQMRAMVAAGELGRIRFVNAEYPQEWLAEPLEKTGQKQSAWRTDPGLAGISNCVGDIGSHIENMVSYITELKITSLCARLDSIIPERPLDDNASILVEYDNGAKGIYWSSQIAIGNDNSFRVRIYGDRASLEWCQERPDYVKVAYLDKPTEILSRGRDQFYPRAQELSRIPSGHPEGYFEAFANIYVIFCAALHKKMSGESLTGDELDFPGIEAGIQGVHYIEKCVESSQKGAVWIML